MGSFRNSFPLSAHFNWYEAEITTHRTIDNTIPDDLEVTIYETAKKLENVRDYLNQKRSCPMLVSSWYRCLALNKAVGSNNTTSFHPRGTAVDFICPQFGTPRQIVSHLMQFPEELKFDQLIFERTWVHIGWDPTGNYRCAVLTLNQDGTYTKGLVA